MNVIYSKFKEVLFSVLPIVAIVLILNFSIAPLEDVLIYRFLIGSIFVIFGLTVFLLGVDIGITPLGEHTGLAITKTNRLTTVLFFGLVLGFFISVAEPGLMVLANQVNLITSGYISGFMILTVVSIGLAVMLSLGFLRMYYNVPLYKVLAVLYFIVFNLALFTSRELLAVAFDASGATTGILAVPFILSLSVGISKLKKDSKASEKDSFGLVAMASIGAIIAVLLLDILSKNTYYGNISLNEIDTVNVISAFMSFFYDVIKEAFLAISPLAGILIFFQIFFFKFKRKTLRKIFTGIIFTFVGLILFLIGVNAGFMDIGIMLGQILVALDNKLYIITVGFVLGSLTILAEPAVYVLTHQIEEVTSGYVKRKAVLVSLSFGVGLAVALSIIRVLNANIQLWHYLLPGYVICIGLMFVSPKLFVGIAFDAGGVATGPMTATFILAFIQGAAYAYDVADLLIDGFGMIAMVAMIPIITLQILGILFKYVSSKERVKE